MSDSNLKKFPQRVPETLNSKEWDAGKSLQPRLSPVWKHDKKEERPSPELLVIAQKHYFSFGIAVWRETEGECADP